MPSSPNLMVGRLPFLVCAPFFHSSLRGEEGIGFVDGVPSFLNGELQAGRIDCAPSSSFEYGLHFRDYKIFPGVSTSSRMEMKSVLFLSRVPWEELDGQAAALSPDSATSNVLFQILCARRYAVKPRILSARILPARILSGSVPSNPHAVGQVFIGDRALSESLSGKWPHRYDLADVWQRWQGLPFSFGLWMIKRSALEAKAPLVRRFHSILMQSLEAFRADPGRALDAWTDVYPSTLPRDLMLRFYETADYGFSPEHAKSLETFYRMANEEGFLPALPSLDFVEA